MPEALFAPRATRPPTAAADDLPNLDILRSVAVLIVLVYHLYEYFRGASGVEAQGWLGIDWDPIGRSGVLLFFVHTSFVLLQSLERSPTSAKDFYLRRAVRLYPLSTLYVVLALLLHVPRNPLVPFAWPGWEALATNLLLVQNTVMQASILNPMWSLPYEVQMYLALPLIHAFLVHRQRAVLTSFLLCIAALALALATSRFAHGNLLSFVPCFMGGVLAFAIHRFGNPSRPRIAAPLGSLLLLAIVGLFVAGMNRWSVPTWDLDRRQLVMACAMCIGLGLLLPHWQQCRAPALNTIVHVTARYSYGLYLTHQSLIWFCFVQFDAAFPVRVAVFVVLLVLVPVLGFHLVEDPMVRLGRRWLRTGLRRPPQARRQSPCGTAG